MSKAIDRMEAARDWCSKHPVASILTPIVMRLRLLAVSPWPDPKGRIATREEDFTTVFDPDWALATPLESLAHAIIHEAAHIWLGHFDPERLSFATPDAANIAYDRELHVLLHDMPDLPAPYPVYTPSQLGMPDGLSAEEYWQKDPNADGGKGGKGQGRCSAGHGKGSPAFDGVPIAPKDPCEPSLDEIRKQVAEAAREAAEGRGEGAGGLARVADRSSPERRETAREVIRRAIARGTPKQGSGRIDYAAAPRRILHWRDSKIIVPRRKSQIVHVGIVVDTSGSMGAEELGHALAVGRALVADRRVILSLVAADYGEAACEARLINNMAQFEACLIGGGGTDLRPAIARAAQLVADGGKGGIVVVVTDGDTPWPSEPLAVPCVACIVGPYANREGVPAWMAQVK